MIPTNQAAAAYNPGERMDTEPDDGAAAANEDVQQTVSTREETQTDENALTQMHTWRKWKTAIVEKVKAAKKLHKTRLRELLEQLVEIDRTLSENIDKDLLMEADELFNVIFKITYYDFPEHAVCNSPLTELTSEQPPLQHDQL